MNRNGLYLLVGVIGVILVGLVGYLIYDQQQKPQLQISVGKGGIEVNGHG